MTTHIKFHELPPVLQAIYSPNKIIQIAVSVNRNGQESYIIKTRDGLANKYQYIEGQWRLAKEWWWSI